MVLAYYRLLSSEGQTLKINLAKQARIPMRFLVSFNASGLRYLEPFENPIEQFASSYWEQSLSLHPV